MSIIVHFFSERNHVDPVLFDCNTMGRGAEHYSRMALSMDVRCGEIILNCKSIINHCTPKTVSHNLGVPLFIYEYIACDVPNLFRASGRIWNFAPPLHHLPVCLSNLSYLKRLIFMRKREMFSQNRSVKVVRAGLFSQTTVYMVLRKVIWTMYRASRT